jgi:hypothetical protein
MQGNGVLVAVGEGGTSNIGMLATLRAEDFYTALVLDHVKRVAPIANGLERSALSIATFKHGGRVARMQSPVAARIRRMTDTWSSDEQRKNNRR